MVRYTAAYLSLRILIDSCPASTSFFFVAPSSCLAPQCFNQFLTSDLFGAGAFPYPLPLLFVPLSPLLVPEYPPPLLLYLGAGWQALLQLLLAPVHLETHRGSARNNHFVFPSLRLLFNLLAQFNSNCAREQMVILVSEFGQSYASAFSLSRCVSVARCRHTSAAGALQVINTHLLKHLQGMGEILSFLVV